MFFSFEKLKYSSKRCQKIGLKGNPSYEYFEPPKKNFQYFDYREKIQFNSLDEFRTQDTVWNLLKTLCIQSQMEVPTWAKNYHILRSPIICESSTSTGQSRDSE